MFGELCASKNILKCNLANVVALILNPIKIDVEKEKQTLIDNADEALRRLVTWGQAHLSQEVVSATTELTTKLSGHKNDFIDSLGKNTAPDTIAYMKTIESLISTSDEAKILSKHRGWKRIIGNTALALTGIGLLAIGIKAAHSKIKTGRCELFFTTASRQCINKTKDQLAAVFFKSGVAQGEPGLQAKL